ncbi:hypothetical protein A3Q32_15405 [Alcanivorax sp. KX64203]|nr:hypothetical protein A3Q32_15405 [Alcanivorax sp. KX64203]
MGALIALPVNIKDTSGSQVTSINLTNTQVCDIFKGTITSWDNLNATDTSNNPITLPEEDITIVARLDDSGTTFAFTQYLAATCNTPGNVYFLTDESYSVAAANVIGNLAGIQYESGNGGVVDEIDETMWTIGYANLANAVEKGLTSPWVEGEDPTTVTVVDYNPTNHMESGMVLGPVNSGTGLPSLMAVDSSIDNPSCVNVIDPAAQLQGVYPIAAVTNLITYTQGNTEDAALRALVTEVVNGSGTLPTGFARLNTGANLAAQANTCIN